MVPKVKVGDVVETRTGTVFRVGRVAAKTFAEKAFVEGDGRWAWAPDVTVLVPRRRVLGYVVREGLERGKGRYYGPVWQGHRPPTYELDPWQVAKEIRAELRKDGKLCRIITVVAKPKTKETSKCAK